MPEWFRVKLVQETIDTEVFDIWAEDEEDARQQVEKKYETNDFKWNSLPEITADIEVY